MRSKVTVEDIVGLVDDMIILEDTSKGDSRTSGRNPSLTEIKEATETHIDEVARAMDYFAWNLHDMGKKHDWTKLEDFENEYGYLVRNNIKDEEFLKSEWWWRHLTEERHHVTSYAHLDVNLLDVLEFIADRVCAEKGRTGSINMNYIDIDPLVLVRAYYNTVRLLDNHTERKD